MPDGGDSLYGAKTIGGTAAIIVSGRATRDSVIVQNLHASNDLYVGPDSDVLTTTGIKIAAGESYQVPTRGDVYGIASAAGTDVRYWEVY